MSAPKDVVRMLQQVPLFSGMKTKGLELIARTFKEAAYQPGQTILKEGGVDSQFFVIIEGKAEVRRGGRRVATLEPYQFFGELAALDFQRTRTADVVALTMCRCLSAEKSDLQAVLASDPVVARRLLAGVRERYRSEGRPLEE